MNSYYSDEELCQIGFKNIGRGCQISRNAQFYSIPNISIGDNVRIDDFCILSGNIKLGSHIHISAYVALYGSKGIVIEDYSGISTRSTIYSAMDDFGGDYLIGPIHPQETTRVTGGQVLLRKYVQIGAHCILFPNITIGEGTVVGACSMVRKSLGEWGIYYGCPAVFRKKRNNHLLSYIK